MDKIRWLHVCIAYYIPVIIIQSRDLYILHENSAVIGRYAYIACDIQHTQEIHFLGTKTSLVTISRK